MAFFVQDLIVRLNAAVWLAAGLCSCANDPFQPLAEALLGPKETPAAVAASAGAARNSAAKAPIESCTKVELVVPTDVDTAYARVMRRLDFRTLDERKRFADQHSMGLMDEGFRYTAQPGAYYKLADLVGWETSRGTRDAAWLEVELSRDGAKRTQFAGKYCLSPGEPHYADRSYRASLEQRLRDSVK